LTGDFYKRNVKTQPMAKKKNSKLVPIFSLIIIIAGLVVAAFLIRRPQNFKPQAAVSDPLAGVSAVASGSSCQCTGSTSACANFATQNKCTANKKCQWACPAQATVTSPNGGEVWQRGKTYRITWNQTQAAGSTGLFLYTRGTGGDTYLGAIAYYVSNKEGANYYDWTIGASGTTNPPDGNNIIVAVGLYDSNASLISSDKSNNPFTIVSPTPTPAPQATVLTPNGGEIWQRGTTHQITWNQTRAAGSTGLFLYTRSSTGDTYLGAIAYYVSNVAGTNTYAWTIGASGTTNPPDGSNIVVAVGLYDSNGNLISSDKSDNPFTVVSASVPQATLTSPNGGEVWSRGTTHRITWNQTQAAGSTGLFLYTRGTAGDTYLGAIAYYVSNRQGANYYDWNIGASGTTNPPNGSNILVGVGLYNSSANLISSDKSDAPFTITP